MSLLREGYGDVNRAFLQAFMSHRMLKVGDVRRILAEILSAGDDNHEIAIEDVNERLVHAYVAKANDAIHDFDLEIRSTLDQRDRSRVFALINTTSDELVQLATSHTADEIAFFKRVLDAMFETNNTREAEVMAIKSMDAVRLHKNPQSSSQVPGTQATQTNSGLTMTGAESALNTFVDEGWLEVSPAHFFSLSPRALMELGTYLVQAYNTPIDDEEDEEDDATHTGGIIERIKYCHGCKEIVTIGLRCSNHSCNLRLHEACAAGVFRASRSPECPTCNTEWTGNDPVGEKAAVNLQKHRPGGAAGKRGGATQSARKGTQTQAPRGDEAEESEGESD